MTHEQYLRHLNKNIASREGDEAFCQLLRHHRKKYEILRQLCLDPAEPVSEAPIAPLSERNRVLPRICCAPLF